MVACARWIIGLGVVLIVACGLMPAGTAADGPRIAVSGLQSGPRELSLDDLKAMRTVELRTATPWTEGLQQFAGVTGADFARALGTHGRAVSAAAINGYRVLIPWTVFASDSLVIAHTRNGQPMTVRDKGPFWIVFPFDADAKFRSDVYRSYAIWSVSALELR